jgi:hypothetical protein
MKKSVQTACLIAGGLATAWGSQVRAASVDFSGTIAPGDSLTHVSFIYQSNASIPFSIGTPQGDFSVASLPDLTASSSSTVNFSSIDNGNRGTTLGPFYFNGDGTSFLLVGLDSNNDVYVAGDNNDASLDSFSPTISYSDLFAAVSDPSAAGSSGVLETLLDDYQDTTTSMSPGFVAIGYEGDTTNESLTGLSYSDDSDAPAQVGSTSFAFTQLTGQLQPLSVPLPSSLIMGGALMGLIGVVGGLRRRRASVLSDTIIA